MKKIGLFALVLILAVTCGNLITAFAWIGDWYEDEDIAFTSIMQEMKEDHGYDYDTYTFTKAALYTTAGAENGFVFDFTLNGQRNGYILMIAVSDGYEVTEIYIDAQSYFYNNAGINIYPTFLQYISYDNGIYYDLITNNEIDEAAVTELEERGFGFNGGTSWYDYNENVSYSTRNVTTDQIGIQFPGYGLGASGNNTCAPDAGMHIITFWDVYKENLIPSYTAYSMLGSVLIWKAHSSTLTTVANSLYTYMGTNTTGNGTTVSQFKSGLSSYANTNGGYSVTYTSTMTSGNYDMTKMLSAFTAGKPVVMFMTPEFNVIGSITVNSGGYDSISGCDFYNSSHTMVAYGRQINKYYNSAGTLTRQITFLKVARCLQNAGLGWIRLNEGYLNVNDSFSIEIT